MRQVLSSVYSFAFNIVTGNSASVRVYFIPEMQILSNFLMVKISMKISRNLYLELDTKQVENSLKSNY